MAADRLVLHKMLKEILGSNNVYFQPPESVKLNYPCFVYELSGMWQNHANDELYIGKFEYMLKFISKDPDEIAKRGLVTKLVKAIKTCQYDRRFIAENLNHDVFTIYY